MIYQEEKFADIQEELKPIFEVHWNEVANNKDIRPLDVDVAKYQLLNDHGVIRMFTARDAGKIVGYAFFFIDNNLHYKTWRVAVSDVYWLDPSYRGSGLGTSFFNEIESWLKALGVNSITVQDKMKHSHEKFFNKLGFNQVERFYEKII